MHNNERFVYKRSPKWGDCSQKKADKSQSTNSFFSTCKKHPNTVAGNSTTAYDNIAGWHSGYHNYYYLRLYHG